MSQPHVLILYNAPTLPEDHPDRPSEVDVLYLVEEFENALAPVGYRLSTFGVTPDLEPLLRQLREDRPDAVVNLFEGFGGRSETEIGLAGVLEWFEIPFTGSPAQALVVARNKPLAKRVLLGAGLPTAPFFEVDSLPVPDNPLGWPVFVKPACQDASLGIDQGSVVGDAQQLERRVAYLFERFGPPVVVERFLPGREFQVPVVEMPDLRTLPPTEIAFGPSANNDPWSIYTFTAKWNVESAEFQRITFNTLPSREASLGATLHQLALRAYTLLGMRDYGRIDFRVLPVGECFILEGNPNPDASPYSTLAEGLTAQGLKYAEWVQGLVANALRRAKREETRTSS